jgi:predicted peptidase
MHQDPQGEVRPGTQEIRHVLGGRADTIQEYLIYRPTPQAGVESWPILLFLHGRAEGRLNQRVHQGISAVLRHETPPWQCQRPGWDYPFIILSPQLPDENSRWHEPSHIQIIEDIIDRVMQWYRGDKNRIYATGFSIGGLGAIASAAQSRRLFAALLPVDGYDPPPSWDRKVANPACQGTPIWSHHAKVNNIAPGIIRLINPNPRETLYSESHVDICRRVYAEPAVYHWLLSPMR